MGCSQTKQNIVDPKHARLLDYYTVGATLGEGAFGVVYACVNIRTGEEVAVKMVDRAETQLDVIKREADILANLNHDNIVKFHQVIYEKCFVCVVMAKYQGDLVDGLHQHMRAKGGIEANRVVHIATQMGSAVHYLHTHLIIHRDVKGDNFMVDRLDIENSQCRVALGDFGTAAHTTLDARLDGEVGTRIFWAPEMFSRNYSLKVDVWAMGIIMFGLLDGRFPFKDEEDIKKKNPRYPRQISPVCKSFIKTMIDKDEEKRSSAAQVMQHAYITGVDKTPDAIEDSKNVSDSIVADEVLKDGDGNSKRRKEPVDRPQSKIDTPGKTASDAHDVFKDGANEGITKRRRELVERLNNEHGRGPQSKIDTPGKTTSDKANKHYWMKWFAISDKQVEGSKLVFEWWGEHQVMAQGIIPTDMKPVSNAVAGDKSADAIHFMLRDHNIDTNQFGKGQCRPMEELTAEIQRGAARLMLDATEFKKLVRVVDVICLRLSAPSGKLLIETKEQFPDGRIRDTYRLPGTKKEPHENSKQTGQRIIKEYLNMGDINITLDFESREVFEEGYPSPTYPIFTVYRKQIVEGKVTSSNQAALSRVGLPACTPWQAEDNRHNTKHFSWMREKDALAHKVKVRVTGSEGVSGLVAPPIGMNEPDLRKYLEQHNIDVSKYGKDHAKSLAAFSNDLIKGESSLQTTANGELIRVVDLINLKVIHPSKDILVQTHQVLADGSKKDYNRLPGAGRRPEENMFLTARRLLRRHLKIEDNDVVIDPSKVMLSEEERQSPNFPGIRTVYRKHLISADLVKSDD